MFEPFRCEDCVCGCHNVEGYDDFCIYDFKENDLPKQCEQYYEDNESN